MLSLLKAVLIFTDSLKTRRRFPLRQIRLIISRLRERCPSPGGGSAEGTGEGLFRLDHTQKKDILFMFVAHSGGAPFIMYDYACESCKGVRLGKISIVIS